MCAVVYYPSNTTTYTRITSGSNLTEMYIGTYPDSIFVFTGSGLPYTSSATVVSASWASSSLSASWAPGSQAGSSVSSSWASSSLSASWSNTSSWAINAINGGTQLITGSTYPITASSAVTASWAVTASNSITSSHSAHSAFATSASWASSSLSASTATTANSASCLYKVSGSGAWRVYIETTYGDLVFDYS